MNIKKQSILIIALLTSLTALSIPHALASDTDVWINQASGPVWGIIKGGHPGKGEVDSTIDADVIINNIRLPEFIDLLGWWQNEPSIAVNPTDPDNIVAFYHDYSAVADPFAYAVFSRSTDRGATWSAPQMVPMMHPSHYSADPSVVTDAAGNFYFCYMSLNATDSDIVVSVSTNGGQSITGGPHLVYHSGPRTGTFADKCWIEVDAGAASPYQGNMYVVFTNFGWAPTPIVLCRSTTAAPAVWTAPAVIATSITVNGTVQGAQPATAPDGTLYVTLLDRGTWPPGAPFSNGDEQITVVRSSDGGATIDLGPLAASPIHRSTERTGINPSTFRCDSFPFIDVGPEGNVYIVYAEDPAAQGPPDDGDIRFIRSTDRAVTWSAPILVNDDATTRDQWWPAITVQQDDGTIHMVWLDRRLDVNDVLYDAYYASSTDLGLTINPNVRVTTAPSNPGAETFLGDYIDIDASTGSLHPIWIDIRRGEQDIFTAAGVKHDVEAINQTHPNPEVVQGTVEPVTVMVRNNGDFTETFDVGLYADVNLGLIGDEYVIGPVNVVDLLPGETRAVILNWDTTGVPGATYTLTGFADFLLVIDEFDEDNNWCTAPSTLRVMEPPVADANGPYIADEGSLITFDASASYDPDGSIVLYEWDWDNDGIYDASTVHPTMDHTYGHLFSGIVGLRVTDNDGLNDTDTTSVTVNNVAPTIIKAKAVEWRVVCREVQVNFTGWFTDPSWLDTHTAVWEWGDGSPPEPGAVSEEHNPPDSTGTVKGSHTYMYPPTEITVTLTVTDNHGDSDQHRFTFSVGPVGGELMHASLVPHITTMAIIASITALFFFLFKRTHKPTI
jgi:hypothetical protein